MKTFVDYMKEQNVDGEGSAEPNPDNFKIDAEKSAVYDGHFHKEAEGGVTGFPIKFMTDDNRISHRHKHSTKGMTDLALFENGHHKHMEEDGQFTAIETIPARDGEEDSP